MAATRQLMVPVNMNQPLAGSIPIGAVAPAAGCDNAGTNTTFTAWASLPAPNSLGIMYANNGSQWLWYYNGTGAVTASILIGAKSAGIVQVYSQEQVTIGATTYGYLGPFSPSAYNQGDINQFGGTGGGGAAPGGVIGAAGQGLTCIDFSSTTNLAVRLYQTATVFP
jgi:hypothetical protein